MTDQLLTENRISFATLAGEQNVSIPTVWRWAMRGIKGQVLESFNLGAKRFTTREAFARWVAATNGERIPSFANRAVEARRNNARKSLVEAGLID